MSDMNTILKRIQLNDIKSKLSMLIDISSDSLEKNILDKSEFEEICDTSATLQEHIKVIDRRIQNA